MKIKVTLEENWKLNKYYTMMNDLSLSISRRQWAKMMFDELYYECLNFKRRDK